MRDRGSGEAPVLCLKRGAVGERIHGLLPVGCAAAHDRHFQVALVQFVRLFLRMSRLQNIHILSYVYILFSYYLLNLLFFVFALI